MKLLRLSLVVGHKTFSNNCPPSFLWAGAVTLEAVVGASVVPTFPGTSHYPRKTVPLPQPHSILPEKYWLAIVTKGPFNLPVILEVKPQKVNEL